MGALQPGFLEAERELGSGAVHLRLELVRAIGLRVLLRDGEAAVPIDSSWFVNVKVRDAAGAALRDTLSVSGEVGSRILPGSGRYTLTFPPLDGFRALPALTVDVAQRQVLHFLVPLQRDP